MKPGLLVASPQLQDAFFGRSVVLICQHGDSGTMGLVVNRPMDLSWQTVLDQLGMSRDNDVNAPVCWGGPVAPEQGFVVFRSDEELPLELATHVSDRVYISSSTHLLRQAALGEVESPFYLCLGQAGWGPGQLEQEIRRGSWIVLELDDSLIFETAMEDRWEASIGTLGVETDQIWMSNPVEE